jgi:NAD(P)-dependent dehydrogenase (short-subunit alcohol dehydrogenase family)
MISLHSKVAIVTGASRGIGRAIALQLAEKGAKVVLAARNRRDLDAVAKKARWSGAEVLVVPCDVGAERQVQALVKKTLARFGRIDLLINNAGIGIKKPVAEFATRDWDQIMDTNLKGVFLLTREVLPVMKRQKGGQIINVGSLAGKNPVVNHAPYCASKFGLIGFSESVGLEVRNLGIKVSLLLPGSVDTHFGSRKPSGTKAKRAENALTPDEVAEACLFLASQDALAWSSQLNIRPLVLNR